MIEIAICDDEEIIINIMKKFVIEYISERNIQCNISTFINGRSILKDNTLKYDILFLDIEMGTPNGIETAREIKKLNKDIIICFITSHGGYVSSAFEIKAFQYLIKPVSKMQVFHELDRAIIEYKETHFLYYIDQVDNNKNERYTMPFSLDEIIYFESRNKQVILHSIRGDYKFYKKLDDIESNLSGYEFIRCHKSYFVNTAHIRKIYNKKIILNENNIELPISESKRHNTMLALKDYREKYS